MSVPPKQVTANPEHTQVHNDEDALDLTLARNPSTTIEEVHHDIVLEQVKHKLGITQAEWLRLQQEILKFLKQMKEGHKSNEDAALAFLNDTGAKDRFFGLLAGGEAEGMLVNRAGLAWGVDNQQIVSHIAAIIAAWRPTASSYDGSKSQAVTKRSAEQFDNDDQNTSTKRKFNKKVLAMLPADIVESIEVNATQDQEHNSLFVDNANDTVSKPTDGTGIIPREAVHEETRPVSTQVQTALALEENSQNQQALPSVNRPASFTLDRWLGDPEQSFSPVPAVSKPWLKFCVYVGGERLVRGFKLLMVERNMSLASFNSQVYNAYYWPLQATRRNLQKDSVRWYLVHYGNGGSGSIARIEAHDHRAWSTALNRLETAGELGEADDVVLKGYVEVHF